MSRIQEAAVAEAPEEFVAAQMRQVALPVEINRAAIAVLDAELAIVAERKRPVAFQVEDARAEYELLAARFPIMSRGEMRAMNRANTRFEDTKKELAPFEREEEDLLARRQALQEEVPPAMATAES